MRKVYTPAHVSVLVGPYVRARVGRCGRGEGVGVGGRGGDVGSEGVSVCGERG